MMTFFHLKERFVAIFKIILFAFCISFSQDKFYLPYEKESDILDSLNTLLLKKNTLTDYLKYEGYDEIQEKVVYKLFNSEKAIDSIFVIGLNHVEKKVVSKIIKPYKKQVINEDFDKIGLDVKSYNYFISSPPQYTFGKFENNKVGLALKFDTQFYSYFSGNLGITNSIDKIDYVGEFNLHMENLRGKADLMEINWRRLDDLSQFFSAEILEPYILNSDYGIGWKYYYGLIDQLFSKYENQITLKIPNYGLYNLKIGYLQGEDKPTPKGESNNFINAHYEAITLEVNRNLLNDRFFPTKGSSFKIYTSLGVSNKTFYIDNFMLYYNYLPITKKIYSSVKFSAKGINTPKSKVPKSQYKYFGGSKNIRGYDEDQFHKIQYGLISNDLGYILNANFHTFIFIDFANDKIVPSSSIYSSYGIGMRLSNQNTLFNINYGIPTNLDSPTSGKLHFEIISKF